MRRPTLAAGPGLLALALAAAAFQQTPVFRGGVDVVTVDVIVLDKSGAPVTNLTTSDFTILADKKPRRILSADYVPAAVARDAAPMPAADAAPGPTTNARGTGFGRAIIFAVDVEGIGAGAGRGVMQAIAGYLDSLGRSDRVGIVSLPYLTPRVDLTTDRKAIRDAAGLIVGAANFLNGCEMTPAEAAGIVHGDDEAAGAYADRIRGRGCPPGPSARLFFDRHLQHTRDLLSGFSTLAAAMAPLVGPKAIVLVSEGLLLDRETDGEFNRFAQAAERARVSIYALHLSAPLVEAAGASAGNTTRSRLLDDRVGFDGLSDLAYAGRGTALRVSGTATNALAQIDRELSGYYLLSFERSPADRGGQRVGVEVRVNRPGLDVRARREFTPGVAGPAAKSSGPTDLRAAMGTLLRWPLPVGDVGLAVDTFVMPVAGRPAEARVLVAAEVRHDDRQTAAVGYEVLDGAGKIVADTFDAPPALRPIGAGRSLYVVAVPLTAGTYRLKLGVLGADGRRGSVEHGFAVPSWRDGALRVSDLLAGDDSSGAFRPAARVSVDAVRLTLRLELHANTADEWRDVRVTFRVEKAGEAGTIETITPALLDPGDPLRRVASTPLEILGLSPGEYVVTATIANGSGEIARRSRRFSK